MNSVPDSGENLELRVVANSLQTILQVLARIEGHQREILARESSQNLFAKLSEATSAYVDSPTVANLRWVEELLQESSTATPTATDPTAEPDLDALKLTELLATLKSTREVSHSAQMERDSLQKDLAVYKHQHQMDAAALGDARAQLDEARQERDALKVAMAQITERPPGQPPPIGSRERSSLEAIERRLELKCRLGPRCRCDFHEIRAVVRSAIEGKELEFLT